MRDSLRLAAERFKVRWGSASAKPLVSITIATYNRGSILAGRTVPSILAQTYSNFELIIVGDACTDDTEQLLRAYDDPRLRFENLTERGVYPDNPLHRWMVAGTVPINRALAISRGDWIAYCDDDDTWTPDHLDVLLKAARESGAEFVYGAGMFQRSPEEWLRIGSYPPKPGNVMHSAVMYRGFLRFLKYDIEAWRDGIGGDAHLWKRMRVLGVRFKLVDRVICESPLRPGEALAGHQARLEAEREWTASEKRFTTETQRNTEDTETPR